MNLPEKRPVTIEDLLRLKRAERPPPEFWARFEADMRAKQLSAIVTRPRWSGLEAVLGLFGRYQLPLGAAAAVALTYLGYTQLGSAPAASAAPLTVHPKANFPAKAAPAAYELDEPKPAQLAAKVEPAAARPAVVAAVPVVSESSSHVVPVPVAIAPVSSSARSPFGDGFAVSLADYRESASAARPSNFGSDSEFEVVSTRTTAVAEPLARMDPTSERRSRLLDSALPSSRSVSSDWIRTRASSDDRMAESMDRASDHLLTGIRF